MHLPWAESRLPLPGGGSVPFSTSLTAAEARELARLAAGRAVLEVGSGYGYSACAMALAGARVTSVDHHGQAGDGHGQCAGSRQVMEGNLAACGVRDEVTMITGRSADVLPSLSPGFGLVFIDGDHRFAGVRADMLAAMRLAAPGGIIACHDYAEECCCPEVRKALDEIIPAGPDHVTDTMAVYLR